MKAMQKSRSDLHSIALIGQWTGQTTGQTQFIRFTGAGAPSMADLASIDGASRFQDLNGQVLRGYAIYSGTDPDNQLAQVNFNSGADVQGNLFVARQISYAAGGNDRYTVFESGQIERTVSGQTQNGSFTAVYRGTSADNLQVVSADFSGANDPVEVAALIRALGVSPEQLLTGRLDTSQAIALTLAGYVPNATDNSATAQLPEVAIGTAAAATAIGSLSQQNLVADANIDPQDDQGVTTGVPIGSVSTLSAGVRSELDTYGPDVRIARNAAGIYLIYGANEDLIGTARASGGGVLLELEGRKVLVDSLGIRTTLDASTSDNAPARLTSRQERGEINYETSTDTNGNGSLSSFTRDGDLLSQYTLQRTNDAGVGAIDGQNGILTGQINGQAAVFAADFGYSEDEGTTINLTGVEINGARPANAPIINAALQAGQFTGQDLLQGNGNLNQIAAAADPTNPAGTPPLPATSTPAPSPGSPGWAAWVNSDEGKRFYAALTNTQNLLAAAQGGNPVPLVQDIFNFADSALQETNPILAGQFGGAANGLGTVNSFRSLARAIERGDPVEIARSGAPVASFIISTYQSSILNQLSQMGYGSIDAARVGIDELDGADETLTELVGQLDGAQNLLESINRGLPYLQLLSGLKNGDNLIQNRHTTKTVAICADSTKGNSVKHLQNPQKNCRNQFSRQLTIKRRALCAGSMTGRGLKRSTSHHKSSVTRSADSVVEKG